MENERAAGLGGYLMSEQACALTAEVQSMFCVGAWASILILVLAVIDAHLRETELPGFRGSTKELIDALGGDPELHWLRKRRNALVHADADNPALTVDQQWGDRQALEQDARKAIGLMFKMLYLSPWV